MSVQAAVQLCAARLHVPFVRQNALAVAWSAPEHDLLYHESLFEPPEHVPGHSVFSVHAAPPVAHLPPLTGQALASEQAAAAGQDPPGQFAPDVHGFLSLEPPLQILWLQVPGVAEQSAAVAHDLFAGLLQTPQSVSNRQTVFALLLQTPTSLQSVFLVQELPDLLHVPPMIPQSLCIVQTLLSMLQLPASWQSVCCVQLLPVKLHEPATGRHCLSASAWLSGGLPPPQLVFVMLQVPGLSVHTGGAHWVLGTHGFSGSDGRRLQPVGV